MSKRYLSRLEKSLIIIIALLIGIGILLLYEVTSGVILAPLLLIVIILLIILLAGFVIHIKRSLGANQAAERKLSESKEMLQAIINATSAVIYVKDTKGKYLLVNKQFKKVHQCGDEIIGKSVYDLFPEDIADQLHSNFLKVLTYKKSVEFESFIPREGEFQNLVTNIFPLKRHNGELYAIAGIITNITDVVAKEKLERQQELIAISIEAQEKERAELSKELHDNVNQILATAKIMLDTAIAVPDLKEMCIEKTRKHILDSINEIRRISHALRPPTFDNEEFTSAIGEIVDELNLSGDLFVNFQVIPDKETINFIPDNVKIALYRIVQEQVNNVLKYSGASDLSIELKLEGSIIGLEIEDNGCGFHPTLQGKGIGLKNMENRVEVLMGKMQIISAPGKGCKIEIKIPYLQKMWSIQQMSAIE
ncbi:MAG: ATP-binding protein [Candidatus Dadabacteria bacterium]